MHKTIDSQFWDEFGALYKGLNPNNMPRPDTYEDRIREINKILDFKDLKNVKSIDIDYDFGLDTHSKGKLLAKTPEILEKAIGKIDFNDNWMVFYKYKDIWRSRKLDEVTSEFLLNQANVELGKSSRGKTRDSVNTVAGYMRIAEHDYDFMPVAFSEINTLRLVNVGKFNKGSHVQGNGDVVDTPASRIEDDPLWTEIQTIQNPQIRQDAIRGYYARKGQKIPKKQYKTKQGRFWMWTCKLPVNLERYMIFNTLDDRTIKLMDTDNCLIYACKQFGLPDDIIDHMKEIIKTKSFTLKKLKEIAEDTEIGFVVEEKNGRHHKIYPSDKEPETIVPLLLLENHYMLNERIKIAPYYIRNIYDINADPLAQKRPLEERQMIDRCRISKTNKKYYMVDKDDYPLKLILSTIFEVGGFEPIKMGEYLTYASTLYRLKLDPIESLDYNPKFCCRVKKPYERIFPYSKPTGGTRKQ